MITRTLTHNSMLSSILSLSLTIFSFSSEIAFSVAYSSAKQFWSFQSSSSISCARKNRTLLELRYIGNSYREFHRIVAELQRRNFVRSGREGEKGLRAELWDRFSPSSDGLTCASQAVRREERKPERRSTAETTTR